MLQRLLLLLHFMVLLHRLFLQMHLLLRHHWLGNLLLMDLLRLLRGSLPLPSVLMHLQNTLSVLLPVLLMALRNLLDFFFGWHPRMLHSLLLLLSLLLHLLFLGGEDNEDAVSRELGTHIVRGCSLRQVEPGQEIYFLDSLPFVPYGIYTNGHLWRHAG
jgi:hypothetical protein